MREAVFGIAAGISVILPAQEFTPGLIREFMCEGSQLPAGILRPLGFAEAPRTGRTGGST
jgi:hypothetical protein